MGKYKTKEDAKAALTAIKEEKKVAFEELRAFEKENSLAKDGDHSGDKKLGKKWSKLKEMHTKKKAAAEAIQKEIDEFKANKPARVTSYDYPKDVVTAGDKKKYRAKERARKKKEAKEGTKAEGKKDKKEEGKKATTETSGKSSKKDKKAEKKGNGEKKAEAAPAKTED